MEKENSQPRNLERRNFLKYLLFAGGGFVMGKFLDFFRERFFFSRGILEEGLKEKKTKSLGKFLIKETENTIEFYDKSGYKILVIEQ